MKEYAKRSEHSWPKPIWRLTCLLLLVYCLVLAAPAVTYGASGQSFVEIYIEGLVTDESGKPRAGEELVFSVYTGNLSRDVEEKVWTDEFGAFSLYLPINQRLYQDDDTYSVTVQVRVYFGNEVEHIDYQPGAVYISESSDLEALAETGRYEDSILLFYSERLALAEDEDETPEFPDFSVTLGTSENPCRFELTKDEAAQEEPILLTVHFLEATTGQSLAAEEQYLLRSAPDSLPHQVTTPKTIDGLAPLAVVWENQVVLEAGPDRPITGYTIEIREESAAHEVELFYYYHQDRDGDGVPDHQVTEQFLTTAGEPIADIPERSQFYNHRESLPDDPPDIDGYQYQELERETNTQWVFALTADDQQITSDTWYRYRYEKIESNSGGGSLGKGGKDKDKDKDGGQVPPEDIDANTSRDETPGEEPPPGGPEPPTNESDAGDEPAAVETPPSETTIPIREQATPSVPMATDLAAANDPDEADPESRTITFVKQSLRKEVAPGEEVSYAFTGFENPFGYPLHDFTVLDQPDLGLDFLALELPAFHQGEGVRLSVSYVTSQRGERVLVTDHPADRPLTVVAPTLPPGEQIAELYVHMGTVPAGFGVDDQILITFQVWNDPPEDQLHNRGVFYYKGTDGSLVEYHSGGDDETDEASIWVRLLDRLGGSGGSEIQTLDTAFGGNTAQTSKQIVRFTMLLLMLALLTTVWYCKNKRVATK